MEATNRRWLLNERRDIERRDVGDFCPPRRGFLDRVDVLLTYRQQLAEELREVDSQLNQLWGERAASAQPLCAGDQPT